MDFVASVWRQLRLTAFHYYVYDDRRTHDGGYGVEGNDASVAGQNADDVAEQGNGRADKNGSGNKIAMVVGA